ncbi:DUF805 domain-containing protein [Cohaesibacter haloalkalitolerans]|uniref:DUF805 domain-containing protein n=1 Tax=Cohaesibacter haloalkalitolerans TaxID=1162980 RepID=UPI000E65667E|nr:DUF805 domain-containing protein [Cohaesibacter haloalkalitolerans]
MTFFAAISSCLRHSFDFSGRAPRSEYWYWGLFIILCSFMIGLLGALLFGRATILGVSPLTLIFVLATALPGFSAMVRRLHDVGKSGWWWLISVVPVVNLYFYYLLLKRGTDGPNKYGDDPLSGGSMGYAPGASRQRGDQALRPFSDEELARLLPDRATGGAAGQARPRTSVPTVGGQKSTGFGRRGAGNNPGFRGFQTTQQRLGKH